MVKVGMGVDYKFRGQLVVTQVMSQALFFVFSETAGIYNNAIAGGIVSYVTACSQCIEIKCFTFHGQLFLCSSQHGDELIGTEIFGLVFFRSGPGDTQHALFVFSHRDNHFSVQG